MSDFMKKWKMLYFLAETAGTQCVLVNDEGKPIARTMHPSFMASRPPKYDPERDKEN